jgi:RNA polymerase primary sigma factor
MRQLKINKSITNRESLSLEKYLQEISKVEMISLDEEIRLAKAIKLGCQKSLDTLTKANLRFVVSVAKQYQNQGLTLPDLINEGNVGLIKAAQKFDESKGFKFISYAVWWIRQSILQALAEQSRIVRLPLNKVGLSSKISKATMQLEQEFERDPSAEEIAQLLNMDLIDIAATMNVSIRHVSMDAPIGGEGEETCLSELMCNPNADATDNEIAHNQSLKMEVQRYLCALPARQKDVISAFFGIGCDESMSLEDIGRHYGLTRERVRQIKDKALLKLKADNKLSLLRAYLG